MEYISLDELETLYENDIRWKDKLEDKAKTNVIGVTISITLIMGAYTLVQSLSGKLGTNVLFWIMVALFIFSVVYMLRAGIHAIHVLTAENVIYYSAPALKDEEKKRDLNLQIGLNRAQNTLRNNYVYTSYECIRNALICLFIVMVIVILPIQERSTVKSYSHGNFFYSEQAMRSIVDGIDKNKVETFINDNISDGDHSVIDQADHFFIKYSVSNEQVTVYLVEQID